MRIHRIVLRNFRGVVTSTVTFPEVGVTIVEGDNEVGKSCIAESIDLVLHDPDSAKNRLVKAVCPVHRDEGPEVEIEMTTGAYRFVLAKRWLRKPKTELTMLEPQRANLVGRDAHDRVQEILAETLDRQLFDALRLEQGVDLQVPGFDVPSLGRALDMAVGGDLAGEREDDLWTRITAERDRYWTPTGLQKVERSDLARRLDDAKAVVAEAEAQLSDLDATADEVADLGERARVIAASEAEYACNEELLARRWEMIDRRQVNLRQLASDRDAASLRVDRLHEAQARRADLVADVGRLGGRTDALTADAARAEPALAELRRRSVEVHRRVEAAKLAVLDGERLDRLACDDRDVRRGELELAQMTERFDRVVAAQRQVLAADALLEGSCVDAMVLAALEAAHIRVLQAEAAAEQGSAQFELTSLDGSRIEIDGEAVGLHAGGVETRQISDAVDLTVPGVVHLRVTAGADARDAAAELTRARDANHQLLASAGVADLDDARAAAAERDRAERARDDAATTIRHDLRDLTLEVLSAKIERLRERVGGYALDRVVEPPMPPDLDAAQLVAQHVAVRLDDLRAELRRCDDDAAAMGIELQDAQLERVTVQARLDQAVALAHDAAEALEVARAERSDDALDADLAAATTALEQAERDLDAARAQLAGDDDPDTVSELLANTREARRRAVEALRDLRERRIRLETKLEVKGEEGLAQDLAEAERAVAHLQDAHDRLEARAQAARLLHDRFAVHRDEARERYLSPFQQKIERLGRVVFGPTFEVTLDRDLKVATRTLHGVTLEIDQLSVGAREQLAIVSRLACAALVSGNGGAPVILDDALGWTDPSRLERMGAAIAIAARECQVIVLTCTPDRYQSVGNAAVVHLAS